MVLEQNELNSDIALFNYHVQTCFAKSQVVAGCEKLSHVVESSSAFCTKSVHVAR